MDKERAKVITVAIVSGVVILLAVLAAITGQGKEWIAPLLSVLANALAGN